MINFPMLACKCAQLQEAIW